MKPEPTALYPADDCVIIDGFSESYQLCNLARDESFGWPIQDPDLDGGDPFNLPTNHGLDFVFDPVVEGGTRDWAQSWPIKTETTPVPESAWQQLALKLTSPALPSQPVPESTNLTPALIALDLPKDERAPDDYVSLGSSRRQFPEKSSEHSYALGTYLGEYAEYCNEFQYEDQEQSGTGDVITIGSYTQSERALKLLHYRQKRARRNFTKRVLYGCRKEFADSRPRVGGRFVIDENRVIKPKTFLKRGRPRKVALPLVNYLATGLISN